jgi:hypothetical protein
MTNSDYLRGPWLAVLSMGGEILDRTQTFDTLNPGDGVEISIRRGTALPDEDGYLPGTCKSGDVIELWQDLYVEDGDPSTDAPARWAQAQAMAAGLNAAGGA